MHLLKQIEDEVDAELQGGAQQPATAPPAAAMAQSAELLGQPDMAPQSAAEAQSAELQGPEVPDHVAALLVSPEAGEVLGPVAVDPAMVAPEPALIERVRRIIEDEVMPGPMQPRKASRAPSLPTIHEVPEVQRDPTVSTEAHPVLSRGPASKKPGLPTIREMPEIEHDHSKPSEAHPAMPGKGARKPGLPTIDEETAEQLAALQPAQPAAQPKTRKRDAVAGVVDDLVGPGVASSAQGPGDAAAHVLGMPNFGNPDDPQFGDFASDMGTGMGLVGGGVSTVGAAARVYNAQRNLRDGKKEAREATDESQQRAAAAKVKGAKADLAMGSTALTGSGMGTGNTIAGLAGAAESATGVVGAAGGTVGAVGGAALMVRHGRKSNHARIRHKALKRLKDYITDPELQAVRAYAQKKNKKAAIVQGVQSAGGAMGMGGGIAAGVALTATAATPVGWALGGAAAGIGLGTAGYFIGRKLYKDKVVKPRRAKAGLDPDKRRAMAKKLQQKLDDPLPGIRMEAEAVVKALGLTLDEARGVEGIELLKKKMRTT